MGENWISQKNKQAIIDYFAIPTAKHKVRFCANGIIKVSYQTDSYYYEEYYCAYGKVYPRGRSFHLEVLDETTKSWFDLINSFNRGITQNGLTYPEQFAIEHTRAIDKELGANYRQMKQNSEHARQILKKRRLLYSIIDPERREKQKTLPDSLITEAILRNLTPEQRQAWLEVQDYYNSGYRKMKNPHTYKKIMSGKRPTPAEIQELKDKELIEEELRKMSDDQVLRWFASFPKYAKRFGLRLEEYLKEEYIVESIEEIAGRSEIDGGYLEYELVEEDADEVPEYELVEEDDEVGVPEHFGTMYNHDPEGSCEVIPADEGELYGLEGEEGYKYKEQPSTPSFIPEETNESNFPTSVNEHKGTL